jgi:dihydrofolate reductase
MISAIFALARDGAFGHGNTLPWLIGPDLQRFKELTTGHPIIMGRGTYESIGRPLPKRRNIVVTSQPHKLCPVPQAIVPTVGEALLDALAHNPEPFVIGGIQVLLGAWPKIERIYLTEVHNDYPQADVRFSLFKKERDENWHEHAREDHNPGGPGYSFVELRRTPRAT